MLVCQRVTHRYISDKFWVQQFPNRTLLVFRIIFLRMGKRLEACPFWWLDKTTVGQTFVPKQREKLGTLGRVPEIYTNIYHLYMDYITARVTTARVPSQGYPRFPFTPTLDLFFCGWFPSHFFLIRSNHNHFRQTIWVFPKIVGFPPKSSILIGFSIINHPFWGPTPIFGNPHITFPGVDFQDVIPSNGQAKPPPT